MTGPPTKDLTCVDLTDAGHGPYHVYACARPIPETPQTYAVAGPLASLVRDPRALDPTYFVAAAKRDDGRSEWWNNFMSKPQATALCAALNAWWASDVAREVRP